MWKRILLSVLLSILVLNTIRKSHVCDHEAPLEENEKIKVSKTQLERFKTVLSFQTVSYEDRKKINYTEFNNLWNYIQSEYSIIFDHGNVEQHWVHKYTLILKIKGENNSLKPGLFIAHSDVVPTSNKWKTDPFDPEITDFIQARGAFDCKGLMMAHLEVIKLMLEEKKTFTRDVFWIFTHDEEIAGLAAQASVEVFKNTFGIKTKGFAFIIDEGAPPLQGTIPFNNDHFLMLGYTAKGGVVTKLEVEYEKAGHGSIPAKESAITILVKALQNVINNPQPNMFGYSIEYYTFEGLTPYLPFPINVITANLWLFGPLVSRLASYDNVMNSLIRTTTAITMVDAGFKQNVIPTTAQAIIDNRIHPAHSIDGVLKHLKNVINDDRVQITRLAHAKEPDPMTPKDSIFGDKIRNSIHRTLKDTHVIPSIFIAMADSRWLLDLSDHIFRFNPLKMNKNQISGIHGPNERIAVTSYEECINFFYDLYNHLDENNGGRINNEL